MELDLITVDRTEARKAFLDYRRACRANRSVEDEAMMRAYREASRGKQLMRLSEAIAAGGIVERENPPPVWSNRRDPWTVQLPALVAARADVLSVWTGGIDSDGGCALRYTREPLRWNSRQRFRIQAGTFAAASRARDTSEAWRAMAPNIPPALRPDAHLRNYTLLWEAEWERDRAVPPVDPALLKQIGGDLYAVLAVWDLTPLEQAVLAGTRA